MKYKTLGTLAALLVSGTMNATTLEGFWQGDLEIPQGPTIPIGIEVFSRPDGALWASASSVSQGQRYMPVAQFSVEDNRFSLTLISPPATISGSLNDAADQLDATFEQGGGQLPMRFSRVAAMAEIDRPQTPKNRHGYLEKEVWIEQPTIGWLSATLSVPDNAKNAPAVLLLSGSGAAHRDEHHSGHRPMAVLADRLARAGLIVLRFDKRGVYKSTGTHNPVALGDTFDDAQVALDYLMTLSAVEATRVGVVGHSEGALIAGMLAAVNDLVSVVSLAGPGMKVIDLLQLQDQTEALAAGATTEQADALAELTGKMYRTVMNERNIDIRMGKIMELLEQASELERSAFQQYNGGTGTLSENWLTRPRYADFLSVDPADSWSQVSESVLVVNGLMDSQVPAAPNVAAIVKAIPGPATVCTPESVNHMLQPASNGATSNYASIEETVDEDLLSVVVEFVQQTSGRDALDRFLCLVSREGAGQ